MIGIKGNLGFASIEIVEAFGRDGASRIMKEFRPHLDDFTASTDASMA